MNAVVAMPEHDTQRDIFDTHVAIGTLGLLLHLGLILLTFLLGSYLFIAAG